MKQNLTLYKPPITQSIGMHINLSNFFFIKLLHTMAYTSSMLLILISFLCLAFTSTIESRPNLEASLARRMKFNGVASNCWGSLTNLYACIGDIGAFLSNGEAKLSPNCCHSIRVIEHKCWPKYLTSIGFTLKNVRMIDVYCNVATIH